MGVISGLLSKFKPSSSTLAKGLSQAQKDRAALKAGAKYIDIGNPPKNFNSSGFLKGSNPPKVTA